MYEVKQSTALTVLFFAHDVNGDAVNSLTDGSFTKRISKNGAAFGAMTVTITFLENGWYSIPLSTAHTDTLGILTLVFTNAGAKQVNLQFRVAARITDDLAYPAVSGRSSAIDASGRHLADVDTIKTGALAHGGGTVTFPGSSTLANTTNITSASGIAVASLGANVITAASINAAALNGKGDWNVGKTGYSLTAVTGLGNQTANITGNLTGSVGSVTGAVGSVSALAANVITAASINAGALNGKGDWNIGKTGYSLTQAFPANFADLDITVTTGLVKLAAVTHTGAVIPTVTTAVNLTNLPSIPSNWLTTAGIADGAFTAAKFAAGSLNGKGDWNIGKTGYSLSQGFPANFAALSITAGGLADITQGAADKVWSTTSRQLTATQAFDNTGNLIGNVTGSVGSVTGAVTVGAMNTDTLTAAALAADAVQEIADAIDVVATSAALNKRAESFTPTTVTVAAGAFTDTHTVNAVYHQLQDVAGVIDVYYQFDIGFNGAPTNWTMIGRMLGPNDPANVFAWNWGTTAWEQVGTIPGQAAAPDITSSFPLLVAHVGETGADVGKVRIRLQNTGLSTANWFIDQQYVSYAVVPASLGFVGVVQAATATTIDLPASASAVNGYYFPGLVTVIAGTGKNQNARVTAYDGTLKRLTLATAMDVVLDTSSIIQIVPWGSVRVSEYDANVIDADALATSAVEEIADQVWDEALAGHLTAGSTGAALNAAGAAGDPWSTALPGAYGAGTAGKIVGDNLDARVGLTATAAAVAALNNLSADQVWDEPIAGHLGAGSVGEALNAAGAAGDPWTTALPGAYAPGSAGDIIGNNINATISSRSTGADLAVVDATADAIKAKTDGMTFTVAGLLDSNALRINGSAESAARLQRAAGTEILGTCDTGSTTSVIKASLLDPASAVNSQFNGRIVLFAADTISAGLRGQGASIVAFDHAAQEITVTALTTPPVSGDTFVIV